MKKNGQTSPRANHSDSRDSQEFVDSRAMRPEDLSELPAEALALITGSGVMRKSGLFSKWGLSSRRG